VKSKMLALLTSVCFVGAGVVAIGQSFEHGTTQRVLGHRSVALLIVDGLTFKDLDRNGRLDPYEDWRLPAETRAADLVKRLNVEQLAGLMVHGTLPGSGALAAIGSGNQYDLEKSRDLIVNRSISSFITRMGGDAKGLAEQNNRIQELAESSPFGIPVTISTDPRHHFQSILGASSVNPAFSQWPETLGLAAIGDVDLTRRFGDIVRQEYMAVGIRESLAPQADLATEPRWARIDGTFGEDPEVAGKMTAAYIEGIQNGKDGLNRNGVAAVVKHWVGYGAVKDGWDSHNFYGRFAALNDQELAMHMIPFEAAFRSHVAAVMPTYAILQGVTLNGTVLEQVGAGFNQQLLTDLLRKKEGFAGLVLSDWGITEDCTETCQNGEPEGSKPTPADIGMPWGVESLSRQERFAKAINAGVDQIGGTNNPDAIVACVKNGTISRDRAEMAARRILEQKFSMGLFEDPYVDDAAAGKIAGNGEFVKAGRDAQARAVVILENKTIPNTGRKLLPLPSSKLHLYVRGIDPAVAEAAGFTVVSEVSKADLAVIHAAPPFASEHRGYFFGSRQHEGRLNYIESDPDYEALVATSKAVPTVFVTTLERPLILTNVKDKATALLGDFGIDNKELLEVLLGRANPQGHLPFELPSSINGVMKQNGAEPHDSASPLYAYGFGLSY
jgi:beta-glucosidase